MSYMNAKKEKLMKTAYHQFRIHGFHGTGLNQILKEAELGKSQLYHYFESKEDLLMASLDFYSKNIYKETYRFMHDIQSLDEFEQIVAGSLRLCKSQNRIAGCFLGSIAGELASSNDILRKYLVDLYEEWKSLFVSGLDELKRKSLISQDAKTEELAEFFLVSVQGAFVMAKVTKDLSVIERSISKSINYIRSYAI